MIPCDRSDSSMRWSCVNTVSIHGLDLPSLNHCSGSQQAEEDLCA